MPLPVASRRTALQLSSATGDTDTIRPAMLITSVIRTVVPIIVGYLLSLPVSDAIGLTDENLTPAVSVLLSIVYYVVVRLIERHKPAAGVLLGKPTQPVYPGGADLSVTP